MRSKCFYILPLSIFFIAVNSFGQKSYFGYDLGLGISNIRSHNINEDIPTRKQAFTLGGSFQKPVLEFLSLTTGLQLQFKGDEFNDFEVITPGLSGDFEMLSYKLGYLTIPVAAQFHTTGKKVRWSVSLGFTGNILFLNKAKVAEYTPCFIYDETRHRRFGLGFVGSVGMEYQYSRNNKIYLKIRNNSDISDSVAEGPIPFYNQTLMFIAGHSHRLVF